MTQPDPTAAYIRLISSEKHVFIVEKRVAMVSGMIRTMLSSSAFAQKEVQFPDISTATLERVIEYFHYKTKWGAGARGLGGGGGGGGGAAGGAIPDFPVAPEAALELLIAANYLDC